MNSDDRRAIEDLFARLAEAERQSGPRDPEAEAFIAESIRRQPAAPYLMAQTIVVQQQALKAADARIRALEAGDEEPANTGGFRGFFGGRRAGRTVPSVGRPTYGSGYGGGSGFLAGAAQTAMGVAGGVLLGNMLAGLFTGNEANAAESQTQNDDQQPDDTNAEAEDAAADNEEGGFFDSWFGGDDGGGFDSDI